LCFRNTLQLPEGIYLQLLAYLCFRFQCLHMYMKVFAPLLSLYVQFEEDRSSQAPDTNLKRWEATKKIVVRMMQNLTVAYLWKKTLCV
jgi:hypothetical protein